MDRHAAYKLLGWSYADLLATPAWETRRQVLIAREVLLQRDDPGARLEREVGGVRWPAPAPEAALLPDGHEYKDVIEKRPPTMVVPDSWPMHRRIAAMMEAMEQQGVLPAREGQSTVAEQVATP